MKGLDKKQQVARRQTRGQGETPAEIGTLRALRERRGGRKQMDLRALTRAEAGETKDAR